MDLSLAGRLSFPDAGGDLVCLGSDAIRTQCGAADYNCRLGVCFRFPFLGFLSLLAGLPVEYSVLLALYVFLSFFCLYARYTVSIVGNY